MEQVFADRQTRGVAFSQKQAAAEDADLPPAARPVLRPGTNYLRITEQLCLPKKRGFSEKPAYPQQQAVRILSVHKIQSSDLPNHVVRVFVKSGKNDQTMPCQPKLTVVSYRHRLWDKCPQISLKTS